MNQPSPESRPSPNSPQTISERIAVINSGGRRKVGLETIGAEMQLLNLAEASLEETIIQKQAAALGFQELSMSPLPRFANQREENAQKALEAVKEASNLTKALQMALKHGLGRDLPIDRTDQNRPKLALDILVEFPLEPQVENHVDLS